MQLFAFTRPIAPLRVLMALVLAPYGESRVEIDDDEVRVRMGGAFRAEVPRASIRSVGPDRGPITGYGAHGWRGTWLVNTSSSGLVRVDLALPARATLLFAVPVKLRVLRLSLAEPEEFIDALTGR